MQIFNVGALEVLFIMILAFIILGPKRTIESARDVGRWIRDLIKSPFWRDVVSTSNEIRNLPKRMMYDVELQKLVEDLDLSTQEIKEIIKQTRIETEDELNKLNGEIDQDWRSMPSIEEHPSDKKN